MNRKQLVDLVSERTNQTKAASREIVDAALDVITEALAQGEAVTLLGFGSFSIKEREGRKARNPQTGEEILIEAKKIVRFKPGSKLAEKVK